MRLRTVHGVSPTSDTLASLASASAQCTRIPFSQLALQHIRTCVDRRSKRVFRVCTCSQANRTKVQFAIRRGAAELQHVRRGDPRRCRVRGGQGHLHAHRELGPARVAEPARGSRRAVWQE